MSMNTIIMTTTAQLNAFAANILRHHTIELCDGVGKPLGLLKTPTEFTNTITTSKGDNILTFKRIGSDMFLGGVGFTCLANGSVSFRHFSQGVQHLNPNNPNYGKD